MENFSEKDVYEKEIEPLTAKLFELCQKHKIPLLCCTTIENDDTGIGRSIALVNNLKGRKDPRLSDAAMFIRADTQEDLVAHIAMMLARATNLTTVIDENPTTTKET